MSANLEVYCDMDGVLSDFVWASFAIHEHPPFDPTRYDHYVEMGMTEKEFWGPIQKNPGFWRKMPLTFWCRELRHMLDRVAPGWRIASKPFDSASAYGKWQWRDFVCPNTMLHLSHDKSALSAPGRILLDDSEVECERWRERGGVAILWPATYNTNREHVSRMYHFISDVAGELRGYQ